jgi:hypothetical protein
MVATVLLDSGIIIDALNGKRGRRELIDQLIGNTKDFPMAELRLYPLP